MRRKRKIVTLSDDMDTLKFVLSVTKALNKKRIVLPIPPRMEPERVTEMRELLDDLSDEPGVAFATSGTVGDSKIIVRSRESVAEEATAVATKLRLDGQSKVLIGSPITHSFGFGMVMACFAAGARAYYPHEGNVFARTIRLRAFLEKMEFDVMTGVPFTYRRLLRTPEKLKPPRISYAGGETVPFELIKKWQQSTDGWLRQEYGLSEVGIVSFAEIEDPVTSIGSGTPGCQIDVEPDGELSVYRESNPTSYLLGDSPETFRPDGWIRTGDLGQKDLNGRFYLTGRKKSVVFIGGLSVVPEEVEDVIRMFPAVEDVAVVDSSDPERETKLIAVIAPNLDESELAKIRQLLRAHLSDYKMPRVIKSVHELPRTSSGKVDRSVL